MKKIVLASDHAGFELKDKIYDYLKTKQFILQDEGTFSCESMDYPDTIHVAASKVEKGEVDWGIILCGSGEGAAMTANKHPNVRAALVWNTEVTALSRQHNDANILTLPARFVSEKEALEMVDIFLTTEFEGGRHQRRVDKINL